MTFPSEDPTDDFKRTMVRIHIDRDAYESRNPTTGDALYHLGEIEHGAELFRELSGDHEDELIPRDTTPVNLILDERFYSQKIFRLIINLEEKFVVKKKQSFDDIVKLAYPVPPPGPTPDYTVGYRKGPSANPKGSLVQGQVVKVKDGMIFDVTPSDKS
jgi:hypothetical protein